MEGRGDGSVIFLRDKLPKPKRIVRIVQQRILLLIMKTIITRVNINTRLYFFDHNPAVHLGSNTRVSPHAHDTTSTYRLPCHLPSALCFYFLFPFLVEPSYFDPHLHFLYNQDGLANTILVSPDAF